MDFLNKLESKLGKFAVPYLPLIIVICFGAGYILSATMPNIYGYLVLSPFDIVVNHQYWRLFTWVFTAPGSFSFLSLICLVFYYIMGRQLEGYWGRFIFNLYIFGSMLLTNIAFLIIGIIDFHGVNAENMNADVYNRAVYGLAGGLQVTYIMLMSIFLALSVAFKDSVVLFMFIIPMKMKWLALVDVLYLGYIFVTCGNIYERAVIITGIFNFIIYFIFDKTGGISISQMKRKRQFDKAYKSGKSRFTVVDGGRNDDDTSSGRVNIDKARPIQPKKSTIHKCAVCGRTENDSDDLEFRFCSKCEGNYEYCSDHIFTHEHVKSKKD